MLALFIAACAFGVGCNGETPIGPDAGVADKGIKGKDAKPDTLSPDTTAPKLEPGVIGAFSAVAAKGGQVVASAYERSFGDLVVVSAKATTLGKLNVEIVDGVPNNPPSKDPKGYRRGIEEKGDDVGQHTDILITATGSPMIAYRDKTNNAVKFAVKTADKWARHVVVKATGAKETIGLYSDLMMVGGKPGVAFLALGVKGKSGAFKAELRWAEAKQFVPKTTADWFVTTIESNPMPCRNLCDKKGGEVCVLNKDGTSACQKSGTCTPKCSVKGTDCVGGKCVTVLEDSTIQYVPKAVGLWPDAVETKVGPAVFYYDGVNGNLKVATRKASKWTPKVIKGTKTDQMGAFPSAVVDKAGTVHVTYQDMLKSQLFYSQVSPSTLKATVTELIDNGKRPSGIHMVGADSVVSVDPAGTIRVVYQDQHTSDLLFAKRTGPGKWTPNNAGDKNLGRLLKGGAKGYGFFSDLAVDGGKVYGSTFYYYTKSGPGGGLVFYTVP